MRTRQTAKLIILFLGVMLPLSINRYWARPADHLKIQGTKCIECHEDLIKKKTVHPPAGEACDTCHEYTEKGEGAQVKLAAQGNELCFICHSEKQESLKAKKFTHAPITDLGCTTCHSPHATDFPRLLKTELSQLCLSCHRADGKYQKNAAGNIMVLPSTAVPAGYLDKVKRILVDAAYRGHPYWSHPVAGVPDPQQKGKEMSCVSCHDAHVGNSIKRFKKDMIGQALCIACH